MSNRMMPHAQVLRRLASVVPLERECNQLKTAIALLHSELQNKEGHVGRLKFLLSERLNKIDQLKRHDRPAKRTKPRLDAEAERYAEMVKLS
jgi:hypothetical protein